jgi:hypothetical protein
MRKTQIRFAVIAGILSAAFAAAMPVAAQGEARIRVLHASPDAPAVDIYVDDAVVDGWTNVPFGTLSDYMSVPAGEYNVKVYPTGDTSTAVIDADVTVDGGKSYTIAAIGLVADIQPKVLTDDPALAPGKSMVRVVHFSPDAPPVDIAPDGADALISGLAFPDDTGYAELDPGTYDLEVRVAGTQDVALQLDPLELEAGRAYTVFAIGSAAPEAVAGSSLSAVVAMDALLMPDTATADESAPTVNWWLIGAGIAAAVAAFGIAFRNRRATAQR